MNPSPYDGAAAGWATGAARVYRPLAAELVSYAPHALAGRTILDAGAGTGCGSDALRAVGARPVAVDQSYDMLEWRHRLRPPACVGDLVRLPIRTNSVDDTLAAFVLNHLPNPIAGMAELARVTRPGGVVLADVFSATSHNSARDRLDELARREGFVTPQWYVDLKAGAIAAIGTTDAMAATAHAAGLSKIRIVERRVDVGIETAAELVEYRFGQAQYAAWLARMSAHERDELKTRITAELEPQMEPYRPTVIFLAARVL